MPRKAFSAAIATTTQEVLAASEGAEVTARKPPSSVDTRAELNELRKKVVSLERELAAARAKSAQNAQEVTEFLSQLGLDFYSKRFLDLGYDDMYTVAGMQDQHMRDAGVPPGHILLMREELQNRGRPKPAAIGSAAGTCQFTPGVYRCVHGPRVAVRAEPSSTGLMLESLRVGELVRISQIVSTAWGRMDEDELWARRTTAFPRTPFIHDDAQGEEDNLGGFSAAVPRHAYVLIDGAAVGINGHLIKRLSDEEAAKATWPYSNAMHLRSLEAQARAKRQQLRSQVALRDLFVETAMGYVGTPCMQAYHNPQHAKCLPDSKLFNSPLFLDAAQLLVRVVEDLKQEFGFVLDRAAHRLNNLFNAFPIKLDDPMDMEPGDIIFYEGCRFDAGSASMVPSGLLHLEIFVGGERGTESVGSMPWFAHQRTGKKDGVQLFDDYQIDTFEDYSTLNMHFCSLRPWLESNQTSFIHGQMVQIELEQKSF